MRVCTFFGHKDAPCQIEPALKSALIELIETQKVTMFYVGNHGYFDSMVHRLLKQFKTVYPHIDYAVVLAYRPNNSDKYTDFSDTIYPDGLETVPLKYAIVHRNYWMIEKADYVITYVRHTFGDSSKFKEMAERKGKIVISL
ncbi:MAG: hypothetical protein IKY33_02185 [Clostridia bacterium]|nr:hypothetical protein [Clostridia bacterium]